MSSPIVSVVIPTYNQADLLEETLATVYAQTFTDYDIVVVNDGSTDDTEQRLRKYGDRLRVVTQDNRGIGAARNCGLAEAQGRYVALLDHDDLWRPEKLAVQVEFMKSHPECVGNSVPYAYSTSPDQCAFDLSIRGSDGIVYNALQKYAQGQLFLLSTAIMVDREKVGDLRYETERQCIEDLPYQLKLLLRGPYGIAGNRINAIYRMHKTNTSMSARHHYNGIRLLRRIEREGGFGTLSPKDRTSISQCIAFFARGSAVRQVRAGSRWRGLLCYLREFLHQLRDGKFKFLLVFPIVLFTPQFILRWRWPSKLTD